MLWELPLECGLKTSKTVYVSLPGVPYEMKGLMRDEVLPRIQKSFNLPFIQHKTILTYGMGESSLAEKIEPWEDALPSYISLAYLPSPGSVKLRLSGSSENEEQLKKDLENEMVKLKELIGDIIVGYDESETIEVSIAKLLTAQKMTLSVAESCTGGYLSQLLTKNAGASKYFSGGIVCYNAEMKQQELNVSKNTIESYTVVSTKVAEEMALGAKEKFKSDYAISSTGNAGPTTDKTDKTVGVVCLAIATPNGVFSEEFDFGSPREKVIHRSSNKILELLRKEIIKNY
jgi:nicotinamide-nucleotide amidase